MSRVPASLRLALLALFIVLLPVAAPQALSAQGGGDGTIAPAPGEPVLTPPDQPEMAYQPPADADELNDFLLPAGVVITPTITVTPTVPVSPPITPPPGFSPPLVPLAPLAGLTPTLTLSQTTAVSFDAALDTLVSLAEGEVAVVMEAGTFSGEVEVQFTPLPVPALPLTATNTLSQPVDSLTLQRFQVEVLQDDALVGDFTKPVRLIVDLREMMANLDPSYQTWTYFLAYQDEADPLVWHEVPVDVYQSDGLLSAEVTHFSGWAAGVRPERWNPSWTPPTVSAFSGAATYNYPIELPPGRHGLQPAVSLSYSSRGIDGRIRDGESGPIGDGWSLGEISVSRVGVTMETFYGTPRTVHPDKFRLVFNGTGHELFPAAGVNTTTAETVRYYVKDAPGYYLERNYDVNTPNTDGIFWILVTPDGTRYRLGYTADAEAWQQVSAGVHIRVDGHTGHDQPSQEISALAWYVDTVTDSFGNQMTYHYHTRDQVESIQWWNYPYWTTFNLTTRSTRINTIKYNYPNRVTALPAADTVGQLTTTPGTRIEFRPSNTTNGDFQFLINSIFIYHGSGSLPISEYRISSQGNLVNSPGCLNSGGGELQSHTRTVTSIQRFVGTDGNAATADAGFALPATTFSYTYKPHFHKNNLACFQFYYMTGYQSGYGGTVSINYQSDNRPVGTYSLVNDNGVWIQNWPSLGYTYSVNSISAHDGRSTGNVLTTYAYTKACYGQYDPNTIPANAIACGTADAPQYGTITGYETTTQTNYDYNGTTVLNRQVTTFSQNGVGSIGRPTLVEVKNAAGTLLQHTQNSYASPVYANAGGSITDDVTFTYTSQTESYQYQNGGAPTLSNKSTYEYNTAYQGGAQYGNLTHSRTYDEAAAAATPYRTDVRWFYPRAEVNGSGVLTGHWVVGLLGASSLYAGDMGTQIRGAWHYYDDTTTPTTPPTQGAVTRSRTFMPIACSAVPGGGGGGCVQARQTIDTTYNYEDGYGNQTKFTTYSDYGYRTFNSSWGQVLDVPPAATNGRTTTIAYESGYNLYPISTTNPAGQTSFQIYGFNGVPVDGFQKQPGLLKQVTGPDSVTTRYEYDPFGRLHAVYDGYSFAGFGDPDPWNGDPLSRYAYWDNTWNNGTTFLNPGGGAPFLTSVIQRPGSFPQPANSSGGFAFADQTYYDGFARPIQTRSIWHAVEGQPLSREIISSTAYGAHGQVSCQTAPYDVPFYADRGKVWPASPFVTDSCVSKPHTATTYDALGRPLTVTAPDGSATTMSYQVVDHITVDTFSKLQVSQTFNANGHAISHFTNARGQMVMAREYSGTNPYTSEADTRYSYDVMGNLTAVLTTNASNGQPLVENALRYTTMSYDNFGRKTGMVDADMGSWSYSYYATGSLAKQVDAKGQRLCFYYDNLDRLQGKWHDTLNNGCANGATRLASYLYFAEGTGKTGKLSDIRWGSSDTQNRETFNYDTLGRLTTHTRYVDSRAYTMTSSGFDALHRPTSRMLTWPNGNTDTVSLTYDREGQNTLVGGGNTLVEAIGYNDMGQIKRLALGNGLSTWYGYSGYQASGNHDAYDAKEVSWNWGASEDFGRLWRICTAPDANTRCLADNKDQPVSGQVLDMRHAYDDAGNLSNLRDYVNSNQVQTFTYDHRDRLLTAATNSVGAGQYNHFYVYNKLGNITSYNGVGYAYSATHKHAVTSVGSATYGYDANGSMTSRVEGGVTTTQNFNVENELASVVRSGQTTTFTYDAAGIRVKTVLPTGKTVYFPFPGYDEEVNGATTTRRITYSAAGQAVALRVQIVSGANTLYYLHSDQLGSTSLATTSGGSVVGGSTARYYPFGDWRTEPTSNLTDRGFTGHKSNNLGTGAEDIGLIYMQARFYLPGIGRFASADTIIPNPANPQSFNRYSYVLNSPLNFTDPTGHRECGANDGCSGEALPPLPPPPPPTSIWVRAPVDKVYWVQYYGYTESGEWLYPTNDGRHTGIDWGRAPQDLGGSWNVGNPESGVQPHWEFDGTYGTDARRLIPVYAGCHCSLVTKPGRGYAPGRVDLVSNNPDYSDFLLINGHLQDIPFAKDADGNFVNANDIIIAPDTIIGYLDTSQFHVHIEIRRISDKAYVNPFPYFSSDLQVQMLTFQGRSEQTRYRDGYPDNPYYQPPGYYPD